MTLFDETRPQPRPQPAEGGGAREGRAHLVERAAAALAGSGHGAGAPPTPPRAGAMPQPEPPPMGTAITPSMPPPHPAVPMEALHAAGLIPEVPGPGWALAAEEVAMVQHQVMRVVDEGGPRAPPSRQVVLVASALPREGKSFIALNLAASIALAGARPVLLVDADGAPASLSQRLGIDDCAGLRDLMAEPHRRPADLIRPTALDRLWVLPHGTIRERLSEAAPGASMAEAALRLAQSLPRHVVILDTPACLSASVCSALAGAAGQVLLVVDAQRTEQNEVEAALDVLEACPVLQLLLNRVRLTSNDSFGAHGHRGSTYAS
jgi:protein-tyrosine kinase